MGMRNLRNGQYGSNIASKRRGKPFIGCSIRVEENPAGDLHAMLATNGGWIGQYSLVRAKDSGPIDACVRSQCPNLC